MKSILLLLIFLFNGFGINAQIINTTNLSALKTINGITFNPDELKKSKASVFIFLSPECPLCQKYTLSIKEIEKEYKEKGVAFYYVFPGTYYSKKIINRFLIKYGLKSTAFLDPDLKVTKSFAALITPEVFLLNQKHELVYSGKIDNWYEDIGKRRTVITEHYLTDALDDQQKGNEVKIKKTQAVGCFIQ